MPKLTAVLILTWGLLGPSMAMAAEDLAAKIAQYVDAFESPQKSVRDAAEKSLLDLGPAALKLLPTLDDNASGEARQRLARVKQTLEQQSAVRSIDAATVTLHGKLPLADLLKAITQQTGNGVVDFRRQFGQQPQALTIDCNFEKVPFWQALDRLLDDNQLAIYNHSGEEGLAVVNRAPNLLPRASAVHYSGAFRIAANELLARRNLRDPAGHSLQVRVEAAWEPRLSPVVVLVPLSKVAALDENARPLPLAQAKTELEFSIQPGARIVELPLIFALPGRESRKIATLSGELTALVPGKAAEFRFTGLEKNQRTEQRHGSATVTVDRVAKNNQIWQIFLRVTFDRGEGALESHRQWILNNEAWLETAEGKKVPYAGLETTRQTDNEVGLAYLFGIDEPLAGYTFVYRTASTIARLPVKFELKDLELP